MVSTLPRGGPAHPGSRGPRPSPRILDALAAALRLTPAGRAHPFRLAGTSPAPPPGPARQVRPYVADLLRRIPEARAVVTDASYDVIAWNPLAGALLGDLGDEPNLARRRFLEPSWRRSSGGEEFSHIVVARLRGAADRYPVTYGSPACWPSCGRQRGVCAGVGHQPGTRARAPFEDVHSSRDRDGTHQL